jgi:hypothetical protein
VIFRRVRFAEVIERQLDIFERDEHHLVIEVQGRLEAYNAADRDQAEELYGDYLDAVETGTEILADLRDGYAAALEEEVAERYRAEFNRAVARRLAPFALEIENR